MEDTTFKDILGHISELRTRLLVCVVALVVTTVASFFFSQKLAEYLALPIGGLSVLSSIDVTENVSSFMKISLLSGVILSLPIILFEILGFVMPGLHPNEQKWIWMVVPAITFFVAGVAFTYFVMLPAALKFLLNFMGISTSPRPNNYFSFVTNLMFWVGVCFELPILVFVLARLKVVTAKQLLKQWRIAIVVIAILAAVITPTPDPVNMGLMMAPLLGLYFISILFAAFARMDPNRKRMSKKAKVILWICIFVITAGLTAFYFIFPDVFISIVDNIGKVLLTIWNWISAAGTKIYQYLDQFSTD